MTIKKITIAATSSGYTAKYFGGGDPKALISIDGQEIDFGNYSRGINVAVFDETTGKPLFCNSFDTPIGNSDIFADFINSLPEGKIVALAIKGDAVSTTFTDKAKAAFKTIGSAEIDNLKTGLSYTLIGIKGHAPGTAHESMFLLETSSSYTQEVELVKDLGTFTVEAISKPSTLTAAPYYIPQGGEAQIHLNGKILPIEGGYKSGWNLIVLDGKNGQVKSSGNFNPSIPEEVDKFVETIADLEAGEIVAIATKDYAGTQVEEKIQKACSSIGSTMVGNLQYGGSWAIVGSQGAKPGQAVENLDNCSLYCPQYGAEGINVKYWVQQTAPFLNKKLQPKQKLSQNRASEYFACKQAVGIDGDYALVGDDGKGNAYIYHWQDGKWRLKQRLKPQGQRLAGYGHSLDISGNFAIVGQYSATALDKNNAGAAHIYELQNGKWQHKQILQPSDLKASDHFSISVAIDGKMAIAGACMANAPGKNYCGAAYIFQLEGGKWVQKGQKLQPDDLGAGNWFGHSVAIEGNVAIVGAYLADAPGKQNCGAAYIFHLENGKWQQQQLQPPDLGSGDNFGWSLAVSGHRAIVGAHLADVSRKVDTGVAYIYELHNGTWYLCQKIQPTDQKQYDCFGSSVAIKGNIAIVGASQASINGKSDYGAIYVFQLENGKWEQKQKLQPSDLPKDGRWGYGSSFDGSRAIISGNGDLLNSKTGFTYICDLIEENSRPTGLTKLI
ncbi:MAG: interleukin-like EMT inducer domain-containing protein [Trichodesmium sp. MO_231.B1]|nr:interleukin-like EMT inducer domain-containing protein [Trichodesmium sp. MO_231.B1]